MIPSKQNITRDDKRWLLILVLALTLIGLLSSCNKEPDVIPAPMHLFEYSIDGDNVNYAVSYMSGETMIDHDWFGDPQSFESYGEHAVMAVTSHGYFDYVLTITCDGVVVDYWEGRIGRDETVLLSW